MFAYDAFISHSSRLCYEVHEFVDALSAELTRLGCKLFLDRCCLQTGMELIPSLQEAIKSSRVGILILTPRVVESGWVAMELEEMLQRHVTGRIRLLVLRLHPDCPIPHGIPTDSVIECHSPNDVFALAKTVAYIISELKSL